MRKNDRMKRLEENCALLMATPSKLSCDNDVINQDASSQKYLREVKVRVYL